MTLAIEKIKAAALTATQGEWRTTDRGDAGRLDVVALLESEVFKDRLTLARGVGKQNATYIAAANPSAVLELITQLEETQADLAYANSILIKIEKLIEGVEYRGDYAEGVRVLIERLEAAERDAEKYQESLKEINGLIFASGLCLGGSDYFRVRHLCCDAMKEKP